MCASSERSGSSSSSTSNKTATKKSKVIINPIRPVMKPTMQDLFGSDSEEDVIVAPEETRKGTPIYSYITRRLANGISRQCNDKKTGSHYVELKVYSCNEIQNVQPINRWRHSVVTIKNRTDTDTEAWARLTDYIIATRKEFKDCPQSFNSSY